ncbi:hypothetical protein KKB99_08595 [bacterium]|nr:hypothetical protein [bacterium]MBU1026049.1 hypothetical protein [bacterium]
MKVISLKDLTDRTSSRADGTDAAIQLIDLLHQHGPTVVPGKSEFITPNVMEVRIEWNGLIIEFVENFYVSSSFVDEIIYRFDEKQILHNFAFALYDEKTYEKFQKVSDNRGIEIKVIWQKEATFIKPSEKTSKTERTIIYRDL